MKVKRFELRQTILPHAEFWRAFIIGEDDQMLFMSDSFPSLGTAKHAVNCIRDKDRSIPALIIMSDGSETQAF